MGGRQGSNVIFLFKFAKKSLDKKKRGACRPPTGDRPLSPIPGATSSLQAPGGPVAPPTGDRGGLSPSPPTGDWVRLPI